MREGWTYKKLGEVIVSSDLGKTLNQSKDTGTMHPYLCAVNVLWDKIDLSTIKETRFEDFELDRYTVCKGDLLICEGGDTGRAAIWDNDEPILYQNALHRVRFQDVICPRYALYVLLYLKKTGEIDHKYSKGVTIKHLVKSSLLSIPLNYPVLSQQEAIVSELDEINSLLALKREQLQKYDKLAQSLFYEMFGDPVENEKGWEVKKWNEVLSIINGKNQREVEDAAGPYPICGSGGIMGRANSYLCPSYCTIIGRKGNINKPIFMKEPFWNVDTAFGLKSDITVMDPYYLFYFCKDYDFEHLNKAVTIPSLTKADLLQVSIPLPPLPLQQQFASRIEQIESQKQQVQAAIEKLETLLASRMQYWFD